MNKKIMLYRVLLMGTATGLLSNMVFAHHSTAMFDHSKTIVVEGTVREWQWTNPHAWLQIVVRDQNGKETEQGFEVGSPNTLVRDGFKKTSFIAGDKVKVVAAPRVDGGPGGMYLCAKTAQGNWLNFGGPDAKAPPDCKN